LSRTEYGGHSQRDEKSLENKKTSLQQFEKIATPSLIGRPRVHAWAASNDKENKTDDTTH
jgi:hypothetical protein